jgi:hypothetical protein
MLCLGPLCMLAMRLDLVLSFFVHASRSLQLHFLGSIAKVVALARSAELLPCISC